MSDTPSFKAHLEVEVIAGEGVLILSEDRAWALNGKLYELIIGFVDGARSVDEIVDVLDGNCSPAGSGIAKLSPGAKSKNRAKPSHTGNFLIA